MVDCLCSLFNATRGTVISLVEDIFSTHLSYCLNTGNNVRDHKMVANTLRGIHAGVKEEIRAGALKDLIITAEADLWLIRANEALSEEETNRDRYIRRSTILLDCSLNFWENYEIGKTAARGLGEVRECLDSTPRNVMVKGPPPSAEEIPGPSMSAMNSNLQRALQLIEDDRVGTIGIWGQGGVGKTYLLNSINNSIAVAGGMSFNVIFVTASRGCSVEKIQVDFLEKLGMGEDDNVVSRRKSIFNFLKKISFLILLDDLWEGINLEEVGVPYPLGTVNQLKRKVVLTTRLIDVCGKMEVREKLNVTCLREEEAWELFQDKVGQETISSPPIKVLALELVKELKGLPLALEVIGRAMYGKDDPSRWESAIAEMKLSRCEKDDREPLTKVFIQLKYSYDNLRNNNLRDCFLTCALWPEDKRISKVELAQCWMGLGLVDEGDIQRSYTKAYSLIGDLRDASLIQSCGNWYGYVKLHDVIRDMALWIACGCGENNDKWFVRSRVGKHEQLNIPWSKAEYISLIGNKTYEFPPSDFNPCLMKLRVLRLRSYGLVGSIDHQPLKRFTSLTYLDLSSNHMKNIPDELFSLVNLEHLDLSNNNLIEQAPDCLRNLIKLKFLYLLHSGIRTIPEGVILNLRALQVIDLRTCQIFGGGSPEDFNHTVCGELGTLPDLKAASIGVDDFAECESLSGASKLPIRSLRLWGLTGRPAFHLSDISSLGFVQRTLYELVIGRGKMEKITESHQLSGKKYDFPTLNKITLSLLTNLKQISWTGISRAASVFPKLSFLHVHNCPKLEDLPWVIYLPCLERLEITFCTSMKQAFPKPIPHGTFSCLKHLHLSHNSKLVTICDPEVTFPSLEKLVIGDCPQMKRLPFKMHSLPLKLQELRFHEVKYWEKLEWEEGVKSFLQRTLIIGREDYVS